MEFPKLKQYNNIKNNELLKWSKYQQEEVVTAYLKKGLSTRKIDDKILHLKSENSKGYPSMNILHAYGLTKYHKGIFFHKSAEEVDAILCKEKLNQFNFVNSIKVDYEKILSHDLISSTKSKDGKKIEYYTYKYERDKKTRDEAIKIHGLKCKACNFDFEEKYGFIGIGYIEVHHIVPLHTLDGEIEVNPVTDLIPVCSNCHRMIHRKKDSILAIEDIQTLLTNSKIYKK